MTKSEDASSGTTMAQTKTSTEYDKSKTSTPSGRGGRGDRGNARNNTINSATINNKYYKSETELFIAVLVLNYNKV